MRTHVHIHTQALGDANYTHAASQEVAAKWFTLSSLLLNVVRGGEGHTCSHLPISPVVEGSLMMAEEPSAGFVYM